MAKNDMQRPDPEEKQVNLNQKKNRKKKMNVVETKK